MSQSTTDINRYVRLTSMAAIFSSPVFRKSVFASRVALGQRTYWTVEHTQTQTSYGCTHANTDFRAKWNCFFKVLLLIQVTHDVDQKGKHGRKMLARLSRRINVWSQKKGNPLTEGSVIHTMLQSMKYCTVLQEYSQEIMKRPQVQLISLCGSITLRDSYSLNGSRSPDELYVIAFYTKPQLLGLWNGPFRTAACTRGSSERCNNGPRSPCYTVLHLWNWLRWCRLPWLGLQCVEQQALPWSQPSTCLSNGCDMRVGPSTLRTLRLIDEDKKIFLWPGMEQPGGLPLAFFICANRCVWGNMCEWNAHSEASGSEERIMLFLFQSLCCPKLAKVYGNQTGRGQMKWFGTAASLPTWDCCSSINTVQ